jgi:hypothetical protein
MGEAANPRGREVGTGFMVRDASAARAGGFVPERTADLDLRERGRHALAKARRFGK